MEKILISACLIGSKTRYDGKTQTNSDALSLLEYFDLIPICPEVDGGLSVPRDPAEIKDGSLITSSGIDVTHNYHSGALLALEIARRNNVKIAVLKERSPSCGVKQVHDGSFSGALIPGEGYTTKLLRQAGIKVISENEIAELKAHLIGIKK